MCSTEGNKYSMECELKNAYSQLEQIFENAADGMCIIDNNSNIIKVNGRLLNLLEVEKHQILGQKCYIFYPLSICNTENCPMKRIRNGEEYCTYEIEYKLDKKTITILITATPLLTANKRIEGVILTFKDITDIVKYQQELNESRYKAEESNILKTQFLANMSHEIRTPINGIIGLIELLGDTELSSIQREYIYMLKFSADRLLSIINDILDISKIEAGKFQEINNKFSLSKLFKDIEEYFRLQANKKGLDFYYRTSQELPDVVGDSDRLNQVLFNIIGNAIKFTEKGSISLETDIYYEDDIYIGVKFIVKDTGIGIPREKIDLIFKGFNQIDSSVTRKYGGTGLGLTISKKLIELMGGEIEVSSEEGQGSVFAFSLKFLKNGSKNYNIDSFNVKEIDEVNNRISNLNILVAEDDLVNQKVIKAMLEKNKWNVIIVPDGRKTLEYLESHDIDIILMDIYMPEINGFEVAKNIRKREMLTGKYTPIIALTAATMKEDKEKCLEIGMDGYISKPIRSDILYETINDILKKCSETEDLNIIELLDRIDGNKEILREIVKSVISEDYEKEYLETIEIYIEEGDFEALGKSIHKLKGSMLNFNAYGIIDILKAMSENIETRNLCAIMDLYEKLKSEFFKTKYKLKSIIEKL